MDKLVRRVTRIERSGHHREATVLYKNDEGEEEGDETPLFSRLERSVRHVLKAQMVAAQKAYESHLESTEKGGNAWLRDVPRNLMKARGKAMKEMRKAVPKIEFDEEEED
jgi:hypothetical protein